MGDLSLGHLFMRNDALEDGSAHVGSLRCCSALSLLSDGGAPIVTLLLPVVVFMTLLSSASDSVNM